MGSTRSLRPKETLASMTLEEIEAHLKEHPTDPLLEALRHDPRKGAQRLWKRYEHLQAERERIRGLQGLEDRLRRKGYERIAGVDEVGRGALAGPIMAAAVIVSRDVSILHVKDSKKLTACAREALCAAIVKRACAFGVGAVSVGGIDARGIAEANRLAMLRAVRALEPVPDCVLIDGGIRLVGLSVPAQNIQDGDSRCYAIAAASILAKVTRDRWMVKLDKEHPRYGFGENKGYGTDQHREAVRRYGYSPAHRQSFNFRGVQLTMDVGTCRS